MNKLRTVEFTWDKNQLVGTTFIVDEITGRNLAQKRVQAKDLEALKPEGLKIKKSKLTKLKNLSDISPVPTPNP
jgi:predicted transcriptional regulator